MEQILLSSESLVRSGSDTLTIVPSQQSKPASRPARDLHFIRYSSTVTRVFVKGKAIADIFYASSHVQGQGFRWFIDTLRPFAFPRNIDLGYRTCRDAEVALLDAWSTHTRKDGAR